MTKAPIIEEIEILINPIIQEEGCKLYDILWGVSEGQNVLRILIEKEDQAVSLSDCVQLSHAIEDIIEVKEVIPGRYYLEVSSPGLDRPLRKREHFELVKGQIIKVKTHEALQGRSRYKGILKEVEVTNIIVQVDGRDYRIPLNEIAKASVEPQISFGSKNKKEKNRRNK